MSNRLAINEIKPGMVIIKVTAQNGPVKIKKSGLVSSLDMVKALGEMGVQEVEIDPDITVEMPKRKMPKSKTQQLLDSPVNVTAAMDSSISEQFNRSLFLPSVQELPEAWQYYGKQVAILLLVVIGGVSLGWSGSTVQQWLAQSANSVTQVPGDINMLERHPNSENINNMLDRHPNNNMLDRHQNENGITNSALGQPGREKPSRMVDSHDDTTQRVPDGEQSVTNAQSAPRVSEDTGAQQRIINQASEGKNLSPIEPSRISPELLERFEKAVAAVDQGAVDDPQVSIQSQNDVPPVQELPAWVLTQLPSLSFSAHMYATEPADRWVRVNGRRVLEGQAIDQGVRLLGIEPQHVILTFKGQEFSMEALSEW